jgi:hypothetical protein
MGAPAAAAALALGFKQPHQAVGLGCSNHCSSTPHERKVRWR